MFPYPIIAILPDGVSLTWKIDNWDISMKTLDGKTGNVCGTHRKTNEIYYFDMNLYDSKDWDRLLTPPRHEEQFLSCEITALKNMINNLPESSVIDRMSLESRLNKVQNRLNNISKGK